MSSKSNDQGRAYEYAWIETLAHELGKSRNVQIVKNSSFLANQKAWGEMGEDKQLIFLMSARAAIKTLLSLEPRMVEDDGDMLFLEAQKDEAGVAGDVRDIVVRRDQIRWEIGLSIKHNHEAIKHSRLSYRLDFGESWFHHPCSNFYWDAITPIFTMLTDAKRRKMKWSDLGNKEHGVYIPILQAFMDEINRAYKEDALLPKKMVEYLIGTNDYYKMVSFDARELTLIHTFNIYNTLGQPSKVGKSCVTIPVVDLPTELVAMKFKTGSTNTVEMYLNNGWQLSFRIHNASTKVEPSLKFDIQFIGMPKSILTFECSWQ